MTYEITCVISYIDSVDNNAILGDMGVMYLRGIPEELRNRFRALCMLRGKTMTQEVIRFMREEVEKSGIGKS